MHSAGSGEIGLLYEYLYLLDALAALGFFILSEVEGPPNCGARLLCVSCIPVISTGTSRSSLPGVPTMCVGKPGIFLCCAKKRKKLTMKWVA
jgi:hypothetical protein